MADVNWIMVIPMIFNLFLGPAGILISLSYVLWLVVARMIG